jgi:hypothetical protein
VNQILVEETGTDYMKLKEYYPEETAGEKLTIAPGSGPSTDVQTPVATPPPAGANTPSGGGSGGPATA